MAGFTIPNLTNTSNATSGLSLGSFTIGTGDFVTQAQAERQNKAILPLMILAAGIGAVFIAKEVL